MLILVCALLACSPQASTPTNAPASLPTSAPTSLARAVPDCMPNIVAALDVPATFAPRFPFPSDLRVSATSNYFNDPNHIKVVGYTTLAFMDTAKYLNNALPKVGYKIVNSDAEQSEAEASFIGNGFSGAYVVRPMRACPSVTELTVVTLKQ